MKRDVVARAKDAQLRTEGQKRTSEGVAERLRGKALQADAADRGYTRAQQVHDFSDMLEVTNKTDTVYVALFNFTPR